MQISESNTKSTTTSQFALFNLSFRVFFLAAGIFSIISISAWTAIYTFQYSFPLNVISPSQWHAHEMIYGYALAVIAGFVLTAVKNWTGIQTPSGKPLMIIFLLWATARLLFSMGAGFIALAGVFDILFSLSIIIAAAYPIIKSKKWMQLIILVVLLLLMTFNILFYLGVSGITANGVTLGIYGGLYLVVGLIFIMGRRVAPFFIERGVGYEVKLFNSKTIDITSAILFVSFFISELFINNPSAVGYIAAALFIVNGIRLIGWYTNGIWNKSLLWSLYLALWFLNIGFLLFAAHYFAGISIYIAIHSLAYGGIALITIAMMARVALGHTGRDVSKPSKAISYAFVILILGAVTRIALPLLVPSYYTLWIGASQLLWIAAFALFVWIYLPMLIKPRIDNADG